MLDAMPVEVLCIRSRMALGVYNLVDGSVINLNPDQGNLFGSNLVIF